MVIKKCQAMTKHLGEKFTFITFDKQLYCKAKMLHWDKPKECKNLVMKGGFHVQMNFLKVIGRYTESSGLVGI